MNLQIFYIHGSKLIRLILISVFILILCRYLSAQVLPELNELSVVRIKYGGGGDWYGNKTTFINLFEKIRNETGIKTAVKEATAEIKDESFFNYPIAYIAGHGNIKFSDQDIQRLRTYLTSGGFLFADDDYGMDPSFRRELGKVFPDLKFVELPFNHPIYNIYYKFSDGLPKIHEHGGGPPQGLGLIYEGRLVVFYSFNTDLSDGCEDADIHNDPPEKRDLALKMGVNILLYALQN
jgi:hypothetical protein